MAKYKAGDTIYTTEEGILLTHTVKSVTEKEGAVAYEVEFPDAMRVIEEPEEGEEKTPAIVILESSLISKEQAGKVHLCMSMASLRRATT